MSDGKITFARFHSLKIIMHTQGYSIKGKGPLIVLLHSSLSSSNQWNSLVNQLSDSFTCINIDLLGYGSAEQVENPSTYSFNTEVSRILSIVDSVQPNSEFHLLGHSCGGAIALKMAASIPMRILSLMLYEPVAFHLYQYLASESLIQDEATNFAALIEESTQEQATIAFVDYWNYNGFYRQLPVKVQQQMVQGIDKVKLDFLGIFGEKYSFAELQNIICRSLILYGENSPNIATALSQYIAKSLENSTLKNINAGHMAPLTHPELVSTEVLKFLKA